MKGEAESQAGLVDTDNPRRNFLRKVLGAQAFGKTAVSLKPGSDEKNAISSKTVSIQVDVENCTACGQCSRFCLPGALFLSESNNSFSLRFLATLCIDCGLCSQVCPEGALELSETLPAVPGEVREPVEIADGILKSCATCHAPIAEIVDHTLCFVCRQRSAPPAFLSAP